MRKYAILFALLAALLGFINTANAAPAECRRWTYTQDAVDNKPIATGIELFNQQSISMTSPETGAVLRFRSLKPFSVNGGEATWTEIAPGVFTWQYVYYFPKGHTYRMKITNVDARVIPTILPDGPGRGITWTKWSAQCGDYQQ